MQNRKAWIEWIRIISVSLVIFNHSAGYTLYQISTGGKQFFYMILTMLTRINVPLFFMVSGALLLGRQDTFHELFRKKILRFVATIFLFEALLYLCYFFKTLLLGESGDYSIKRWLLCVLAGNLEGTTSYWYLYAYLGMLFMLPFLQKIAQGMERQDFVVLVCLRFVFFSLIPITNILLGLHDSEMIIKINPQFNVPLSGTNAFFYPLMGYYLNRKVDINKLKSKYIFAGVFISIVGVMLSCVCTYYEGISTGVYTQNYVCLFDYVTAMVSFVLIKWMATVVFPGLSKGKVADIVCRVGALTFGIYLLGPFLNLLGWKVTTFLEPMLPTLLVSVCWVLISLLVGGIITVVLKKLPIFKKLL